MGNFESEQFWGQTEAESNIPVAPSIDSAERADQSHVHTDGKENIESDFSPEGTPEIEKQKIIEKYQTKRANFLTNILTSDIVSNGLDLVPFAGGGKMIIESIVGKTLVGRKMDGKSRAIHGAVGAGSIVLDLTGIGELKDGTIITGKSISLIEKIGAKLAGKGAAKAANMFNTTAQFMAKNPEITHLAETYAETKIREQIKNIRNYPSQATA